MDTKTCRGYTILHEACAFGNNSNAHHILCNDKNMISTVSNDGRTILHEICKNSPKVKFNHKIAFYTVFYQPKNFGITPKKWILKI